MRIFLAGATGAIGRRLVPLLVEGGHSVVGTTRDPRRARNIAGLGGQPAVVDCLDSKAVMQAVLAAKPDVVVHQLTALAAMKNLKRFDDEFEETNRLRTEGTKHLIDAAHASGARLFIAQSYAGWPSGKRGTGLTTEADPLDANPVKTMRKTLDAIRKLETAVTSLSGLTGIILRYSSLYGPGTSLAPGGDFLEAIRARKLPVIGGGTAIWSFTHVDDAASAAVLAIEHAHAGIFNIVDDEPSEVSVWLPELARQLGAKAPFQIPKWLGRLAVGEAGVFMMTDSCGSSNAKAKSILKWTPLYPNWREGFRMGMMTETPRLAQE